MDLKNVNNSPREIARRHMVVDLFQDGQKSEDDLLDTTLGKIEDVVEDTCDSWIHRFFDWIEGVFRLCWPKHKDN